jgi:hypothetical protein
LATTTNKAIDSLTEKLSSCVPKGTLIAFGNRARLGATTQQYLLERQAAIHPSNISWEAVEKAAKTLGFKAENLWDPIASLLGAIESAKKNKDKVSPDIIAKKVADLSSQVAAANKSAMKEVPRLLGDLPRELRNFSSKLHPKLISEAFLPMAEEFVMKMIKAAGDSAVSEYRVVLQAIRTGMIKVSALTGALRSIVSLDLFKGAQYFVGTAASTAKLPLRIRQLLLDILEEHDDGNSLTDVMARLSLSSRSPPGPSPPSRVSRSVLSDYKDSAGSNPIVRAVRALLLDKSMMEFPCVILDEAGAMLQPGASLSVLLVIKQFDAYVIFKFAHPPPVDSFIRRGGDDCPWMRVPYACGRPPSAFPLHHLG